MYSIEQLIIPLTIIAIFDGIMKIISMWYAARASQKIWFVCLAIFNTIGILPIVYLIWFRKK